MKSEFQNLVTTNTVTKKSARDMLLQYLSYWPIFVISLLLALGAAYAYIRYSVPLYSANTIINVKGETTTSRNTQGGGDLITNAMNGGRSAINLDHELGRLRSVRLMSRVVASSDLNISYYREGTLTKTDIYHESPFRLIQKDIQDSSRKLVITLTKLSNTGATVSYGEEEAKTEKTVSWNQAFLVNNNTFILAPLVTGWNPADRYTVEWNPALMTVYELLPKVDVNVIGKTNNIALGITIENPNRGEDVLNKMVREFVQMNLDDQNKSAQDKVYFIQERLATLSNELKGGEKKLASVQGENLVYGDQGGEVYGESVGAAKMAIDQIITQKGILNIMRNSVATAKPGTDQVIPSGMGYDDPVLGGLIANYNEAVINRTQQAPSLASGSLVLKDMDGQIANLRTNILNNLNSNIKALDMKAANHARQGGQFRASVSKLPETQRVVNEIARETKITEQLYIYLLQRREETELSRSTTSPYEQIDLATSFGPVSPDRKMVYAYAAILGLVVPAVIVFLISMINDKVSSREEIEKSVSAQIVGEISNVKKSKEKLIPALYGGVVGEQFRIMRANFNFLHKSSEPQTILITSSASGEGKSFISLNLAAVLAKSGKRVALLEFDLRKPPESELSFFHGRGLKDYLMGEATVDDICHAVGELPNLHVYPTGEIVSEAGDLIVNDRMPQLFEDLKGRYDAIVINTPPVGLVGDALVLQRYSNIVGYVIRHSYTKKRNLSFFNSLVETNKFNNAAVVFNGVRTGMKYGYYGYGYAEKNAYFDREGNSKITRVFKKRKKETAAS